MRGVIERKPYPASFFFSLLLHVVIIIVLIGSFEWSSRMPVLQNADQNKEVINARVITSTPLPRKVIPQPEKIIPKPVFTPKPVPLQPKLQPAPLPIPEPAKPAIQPKPEPAKPTIQPKPIPPKKQAIAIDNKKEKKMEQDKIAQQLLADIKKQSSQQKKIKQKDVAAEFAKDLKQLAAKSLQQDIQQEQKRMAGARTQQVQGEVNKYKALILQAISQNWVFPPTINKNLSAELMIRVAPGGAVLDVQVVKSSGDSGLDNSARAAVFKASPLPVPLDADAFDTFRQFLLKVRPKDILNSENWES